MKFNYLNNQSWSEITRDERTFCMYLFSAFRDQPEKLAELFRTVESPYSGFVNYLPLKGKNWELGFEVCFYRDLLFKYGYGVKRDAELIRTKTGINTDKLMKRTFDLCLFSEKEIIIIEAKSQEPFNRSQFEDFKEDKEYLSKIFRFLLIENPPDIYFLVLASSQYYNSPSFTLKNGVAKEFLIDKKAADCLVSWQQIADSNLLPSSYKIEKHMLQIADETYNR